jgi:hypothetical protein
LKKREDLIELEEVSDDEVDDMMEEHFIKVGRGQKSDPVKPRSQPLDLDGLDEEEIIRRKQLKSRRKRESVVIKDNILPSILKQNIISLPIPNYSKPQRNSSPENTPKNNFVIKPLNTQKRDSLLYSEDGCYVIPGSPGMPS